MRWAERDRSLEMVKRVRLLARDSTPMHVTDSDAAART